MISAEQIRAARALVEWSQDELAQAAGVSRPTIKRMESKGPGNSSAANVDAVQRALEGVGVVFIEDGAASMEGGPGVRIGEERVYFDPPVQIVFIEHPKGNKTEYLYSSPEVQPLHDAVGAVALHPRDSDKKEVRYVINKLLKQGVEFREPKIPYFALPPGADERPDDQPPQDWKAVARAGGV